MESKKEYDEDRRRFLKIAGVSVAGLAGASLTLNPGIIRGVFERFKADSGESSSALEKAVEETNEDISDLIWRANRVLDGEDDVVRVGSVLENDESKDLIEPDSFEAGISKNKANNYRYVAQFRPEKQGGYSDFSEIGRDKVEKKISPLLDSMEVTALRNLLPQSRPNIPIGENAVSSITLAYSDWNNHHVMRAYTVQDLYRLDELLDEREKEVPSVQGHSI